jgi:hypothetical protein
LQLWRIQDIWLETFIVMSLFQLQNTFMLDPSTDELLRVRYEAAQKADDLERGLGDVLDVKASVILVAVTFLAALSQSLIASTLTNALQSHSNLIALVAQAVAVVFLSISAGYILIELWPQEYDLPPTPQEDEEWINSYATQRSDMSPAQVLRDVYEGKILRASERVAKNKIINITKSARLGWGFKAVLAAALLDIGHLFVLALKQLSPAIQRVIS